MQSEKGCNNHRYKPEGRPQQLLLQLVSDLTSNFDRFLFIILSPKQRLR